MKNRSRIPMRRVCGLALLPALTLAGLAYTARSGAGGQALALAAVADAPSRHLGRSVVLRGRFAGTGDLFLELHTPFTEASHLNFALWPEPLRFWEPAGREGALPTLYVPRHAAAAEVLAGLRFHDRVEARGWVRADYGGRPWIQIVELRRDARPEMHWPDGLSRRLADADHALASGAPGRAAEIYGAALREGIPPPYRLVALRRAAAAEQAAGRVYAALFLHRQAAEAAPGDAVVWGRLAEAALAADRPEEALKIVDRSLELLNGDGVKGVNGVNVGDGVNGGKAIANADAGGFFDVADDSVLRESGDIDPERTLGGAWSAAEATTLSTRSDLLGLRAEIMGRLGHAAEALALCERAGRDVRLSPLSRAQVYLRRARLQAGARRFAEAAVAYRQAMAADTFWSRCPWLYAEWAAFLRARAENGSDRAARLAGLLEAVEAARRAHELTPGGTPTVLARAAGWAMAELEPSPGQRLPSVWPHTRADTAADAGAFAFDAGLGGLEDGTPRLGAASATAPRLSVLTESLSDALTSMLSEDCLAATGAGDALRMRWVNRGRSRGEALSDLRSLASARGYGAEDDAPEALAALADGFSRLDEAEAAFDLFARAQRHAPWDRDLRARLALAESRARDAREIRDAREAANLASTPALARPSGGPLSGVGGITPSPAPSTPWDAYTPTASSASVASASTPASSRWP